MKTKLSCKLAITGGAFLLSLLFLTVCCGDCPDYPGIKRGLFQIMPESEKGTPSIVDNGTIEIREKDVEIKYVDDQGQHWTVLYDIVSE
jgi:hypothetical protein